jgi:arginase
MGPSAIRISSLAEQLATLGVTVTDKGDIPAPVPEIKGVGDPRKRYVKEIARVCQKLYQTALASLHEGALPIVLGGDHSLSAGSVAATAAWLRGRQQPLGLIWVDAHADINSPATSPSGNVHGMPLAALLGGEPLELARMSGAGAAVRPEHTVLVGIRNLDDREKEIVKASGVRAFTMKDIDRSGIAAVMERAIAAASAGTGGIHVSFDLDACDPAVAPGVGTPVKGGLDYREAHYVMEAVAESGRLVALDLVEVKPALDLRNTTAELATELAMSALGKRIL